MSTHDTVAERQVHEADPDNVEVRQPDVDGEDGLFRIRMPITSTAEARDGEAFSRERVDGFRQQIEEKRIPLFLDHGRGGPGETRYGQLRKVGYWDSPSVETRDGETELDADAVLVDPETLDEDVGEIRAALTWLRAQAEAGLPISSSVGWSESTGDRTLPGDADLLEVSIVGIPSDPRTTTTADVARATRSASVDTTPCEFATELAKRGIRPLGPPEDPDRFDTFDDCVDALSDDPDLSEEDAERICGAWEQAKDGRDIPETVVEQLGGTLVPNAGAAEAAEQALEWAEEHPDEFALGSDDGEGLRRARQLVDHHDSDEPLDGGPDEAPDYWTEIQNFHARHHAQGNHELDAEFEGEPWRDAGYVAHLAWGGDDGFEQAEEVVAALEALADDDDVDYERDTITADDLRPASPVVVDGAGRAVRVEVPDEYSHDDMMTAKAQAEELDVDAGAIHAHGDVDERSFMPGANHASLVAHLRQTGEIEMPDDTSDRNLDAPAFSEGDAVTWDWQDDVVHGRVADIGPEFTVAGQTITGDDGEAVYLIHEWDDAVEAFRAENVAKPESSLDESTMDLPPATEDNMTEENDESDAESDTESDEQRAEDMEEMMSRMVDMQEEQTEILREMYEESTDTDEEESDEPDGESDAEAEEAEERTVTLDGDDLPVDEAAERIADLREEASDVGEDDLESKTETRANTDDDDVAEVEDTQERATAPDWHA